MPSTGAYLDGTKLVLPGTASNSASTPDAAVLHILADIDIRAKIALTDWTPAAEMQIVCKTFGDRAYEFLVRSDGSPKIRWREAASAEREETSSSVVGFTDGTTHWIRATLDVDNGSGQYAAKFYTSDDGSTWTQLGTTITGSTGPTNIKAGADDLFFGALSNGVNSMMAGSIYRVQIRNNILDDGTGIVFDANFATATAGASTFTESSSNAATVTIHSTDPKSFLDGTLTQDGQSVARGGTLSGTYFGSVPTEADLDSDPNPTLALLNFTASAGVWSGTIDPTQALGSGTLSLFSGLQSVQVGTITVTAAASSGQPANKLGIGPSLGL